MNEQLSQFQERLLDETEELQHANAQLEVLRREFHGQKTGYEEQLELLKEERDHLQVHICTTDNIPSLPVHWLVLMEERNHLQIDTHTLSTCTTDDIPSLPVPLILSLSTA